MAISPRDSRLILLGSATGGVWRSTDAGATFQPVCDDQVDLAVGSVAFAEGKRPIAYAGMGDPLGGYCGSGVLRSADDGATWHRVSGRGLPSQGRVAAIRCHPNDPERVYLAMFAERTGLAEAWGGFFRSVNGGADWERTLVGFATDLALIDGTLLLGMARGRGLRAGAYLSSDDGRTWRCAREAGFPDGTADAVKVAVSAGASPVLYLLAGGDVTWSKKGCRVDASSDGGATWSARTASAIDAEQFGYNSFIAASPHDPRCVFVGTRDLYRSVDGGDSWRNLTNDFPGGEWSPASSRAHPDQHAVAVSRTQPSTLFLANDGGLYLSTDTGGSFTSLNATLGLTQFVGLALHPDDPETSIGGTQDNGTQLRLAKTRQWREISPGDGGRCVVDPISHSRIFITYVQCAIYRCRLQDGAVVESVVVGDAKTFHEPAKNPRVAFYPPLVGDGHSGDLFFGTWRLFRSTTAGATWSDLAEGKDLTRGGADVLNAVAVRAADGWVFTGSAQGRVMLGTRDGTSWSDQTGNLPNRAVTSLLFAPSDPSIIYAAVSGFGSGHVWEGAIGQKHWLDVSEGLPNLPVNALVVDPLAADSLWAATDVGVYFRQGERRWMPVRAGMPPVVVQALATGPGGAIQAGTYGRSAFEWVRQGPFSTR